MPSLSDLHLVLFFTRGVSLGTWDDIGLFDREVEIYRQLKQYLRKISFVTYGGTNELNYSSRLGNIKILCNRWRFPARLYAKLAPFLYWNCLKTADIMKSNQIAGAEVPTLAKHLHKKPIIIRCGYIWSWLAGRKSRGNTVEMWRARRLENKVFRHADRVVVTTDYMQEYVIDTYRLPSHKLSVIPNYVITDLFTPKRGTRGLLKRIVFVGRLSQEKNLEALIDALEGINTQLLIIGGGPLRQQLEKRAKDQNIDVAFAGNVPHRQLAGLLNEADLFVLPSLYEGHPKALLEAMACGLPVLCSDVPGIRELIVHRETGYLCGTSASEIRAGILDLMGNEVLRKTIGRNAREFVVLHCSLERVLEQELQLLQSMLSIN